MASPLLEARALRIGRGGVALLDGLSLSLTPGQALRLTGANGIGKTTLLRCLAGLAPPIAGEVSAAPDSIAYASHADGVKPVLSVTENLRFWAGMHGQGTGEAALAPALASFGLAGLKDREAQHLSAGQRRRLGLARLLVTGRPVWLLDEPTVSLDRDHVAGFGRVLAAHLAEGGAALVATHLPIGLDCPAQDLAPYIAAPRPAPAAAGAFDAPVG